MSSQRLAFLDGLRALLACMVINEHLIKAFYPEAAILETMYLTGGNGELLAWVFSPLTLLFNGQVAVMVFFVLSGYLLSHSLYQKPNLIGQVGGLFLLRRYLRFTVPVVAMLLLLYFMGHFGLFTYLEFYAEYGTSYVPPYVESVPSISDILSAGLLESIFFLNAEYNIVLWTISVEMWGSALLLFLISIRQNHFKRTFTMAGYCFMILAAFYTMGFNVLISFVLGLLVYHFQQFLEQHQKYINIVKVLALVSTVILMCFVPKGGDSNVFAFIPFGNHADMMAYIVYGWGAAAFLIFLFNSNRMQSILESRLLTNVGRQSFAIYLLHYLVIGSAGMWVYMQVAHTGYAFYIASAATYGITMLMAALFYNWVEQPVLKLIARLGRGQLHFVVSANEFHRAELTTRG